MSSRVASINLARMPLSALAPHPRNPREHPDQGSAEWEILKKSLSRSYFDPLVFNTRNGKLVSGHLRVKLLLELGYEEADVSVVDFDEATHLAVMIIANKHGGEFDPAILASLATDIELAGLDAALAGYDHEGLLALVTCPEVPDDSAQAEELVSKAEQLQEKWQVNLGDLFQIGAHRLICGDCESPDHWARLLNGQLADMIWTDPPYNVDYDASARGRRKEQGGQVAAPNTILNDKMSPAEYAAKLEAWFTAGAAFVKPGGAIYIAHADTYRVLNETAARKAGFYISQNLLWVKQAFTLTRQDYNPQHEPILYGWKQGGPHFWQGGFAQSTIIDDEPKLLRKSKPELIAIINVLRNERDTTVIREPRNTVSDLHPTVKPLQLVARQIWNSSARGETVAELFAGSGTTMAAAEQIGRRCVAHELDPKFCAVTLERMTALGLKPEKIAA